LLFEESWNLGVEHTSPEANQSSLSVTHPVHSQLLQIKDIFILANMMTALEELQEEVVGGLHTLNRELLFEDLDFLNIEGEQRADVEGKSCISLEIHVMKYLEREEVAELEMNDGMFELLQLNDNITDLATDTEKREAQTEEKRNSYPVPMHHESRQQPQPTISPEQLSVRTQPQQPSPCWHKEFPISGQISKQLASGALTSGCLPEFGTRISFGINKVLSYFILS